MTIKDKVSNKIISAILSQQEMYFKLSDNLYGERIITQNGRILKLVNDLTGPVLKEIEQSINKNNAQYHELFLAILEGSLRNEENIIQFNDKNFNDFAHHCKELSDYLFENKK